MNNRKMAGISRKELIFTYFIGVAAALAVLSAVSIYQPGGLMGFDSITSVYGEPTGSYLYTFIWEDLVLSHFAYHNSLWLILICQCLLFGGIVVAVASFCSQIKESFFYPSAALMILCPNVIGRVAMTYNEILYLFFCSLGLMWLFLYCRFDGTTRYGILAGIAFGFAFLTRGTILLFPLFGFLAVLFLAYKRMSFSFGKGLLISALPFAIVALFYGAQYGKNYAYTNSWVLTSHGPRLLMEWGYPCFKQKFGSGGRDQQAIDEVRAAFEMRVTSLGLKDVLENCDPFVDKCSKGTAFVELSPIRSQIAREMIGTIPIKDLAISLSATYIKSIFYSSWMNYIVRFQGQDNVSFVSTYHLLVGKTPLHRLRSLTFLDLVLMSSEFLILVLRMLALIGILSILTRISVSPYGAILLAYMISSLVVIVIGNPRYRAGAELGFIPLALIGADWLLIQWKHYRTAVRIR